MNATKRIEAEQNPNKISKSPSRLNISQILCLSILISFICIINYFPLFINCQNASSDSDCRYLRQKLQDHRDTATQNSPRQQRLYLQSSQQADPSQLRIQNSAHISDSQSQEFSLNANSANQANQVAYPQSQPLVSGPDQNDTKQTLASSQIEPNGRAQDSFVDPASSSDPPITALQAPGPTTNPTTSSTQASDKASMLALTSVIPSFEPQMSNLTPEVQSTSNVRPQSESPMQPERMGKHQTISRMMESESPLESRELNELDSGRQGTFEASKMAHKVTGFGQPLSSSPSSISIITPILGHPSSPRTSSADQSSQSMMKPIFVLGNPIGERDYNPATSAGPYEPQTSTQQTDTQYQTNFGPRIRGSKTPELDSSNSVGRQTHQQPDDLQPPVNSPKKLASPKLLDQALNSSPSSIVSQASGQASSASESPIGYSTNSSLSDQTQVQMNNIGEPNATTANPTSITGDRMSGPSLVYSDGQLTHSSAIPTVTQSSINSTGQLPPAPRLYQSGLTTSGAGIVMNNPRRPSLPPPVNQANAASGFRSPLSPSGPLVGTTNQQSTSMLQAPVNQAQVASSTPAQLSSMSGNFFQTSLPPYLGPTSSPMNSNGLGSTQLFNNPTFNRPTFMLSQTNSLQSGQQQLQGQQQVVNAQVTGSASTAVAPPSSGYSGRRPLNITRVEHISAECSNDLIRAVIVFNGTFKGIIYSSGYVNDPICLYVNGTGTTRYEFSIRLNQCGTLGRQELHQPTSPGEARRRDQVMWNTLTIQYNSIIEQEWDEHFRVSCEYGSDFWKTVSFSPFNVETNTGSPVVFTINPPQCQMDVLLGHGIGPKIAVDGPVTVGDPLTLLIHMKSEKAGYDILVKNCVAHNGGKQRMQLIDSNGCVVNERFISPFRGTYNDNDLRHVTLYAYLKAFRFTGSPVLYLECEIHMCQSACPPQMCYWRRLSKRSVDDFEYEYRTNTSNSIAKSDEHHHEPLISDSVNLFKALQVRHESEPTSARSRTQIQEVLAEDSEAQLICYRHAEVLSFLFTIGTLLILLCSIAIACCLRVRRLSRDHFKHGRLSSSLSSSSSLSPSLLSISDAISSAGSTMFPPTPRGTSVLSYYARPKVSCTRTHGHYQTPPQSKPIF